MPLAGDVPRNRELAQAVTGRGTLDRLAIGLSGLCAAHCVATVVLVTLVASVGSILFHPIIHEIGLACAVALGALGLGRGVMAHRRVQPALVGALGLGLMAAALTVPHGGGEAALTIAGVALVALGHHLNRRALA
jgi:hypothetical protein